MEMKRSKMKSYYLLIIAAIVVLAIDFVADVPHLPSQPYDYQTAHYGLLAVVGALIFGGLVEWRLEIANKKLDRLLIINHRCPRGHVWPVEGCPFCRRDSRYL
jgi:hypothetical protein